MQTEYEKLKPWPVATSYQKKPGPALYETDESRYAGPHPWQISFPAQMIRRLWHRRAYSRWYDQAVTSAEVTGVENLQAAQARPGVFVANHGSHLDSVVISEHLPAAIRSRLFFAAAQDRWFVKGKKKMVLKPWYQSLVLGNFPIMRGGGRQALRYADWLLEKKRNVLIFPEGTRAMDSNLGAFRHGAVLLALQHNVPIYPIYLGGLRALQPKGQREVQPGSIRVKFLPPIHFSPGSHVEAATDLLYERMNKAHLRDIEMTTGNDMAHGPADRSAA